MKSLQAAREAAETTRRLADEHAWAHRDADPGNGAIAKRGAALKHAAATANGELLFVERAQRAAAVSKRRTEQLADDAGLQSRLRAEAQTRSEEAARRESPPPRGAVCAKCPNRLGSRGAGAGQRSRNDERRPGAAAAKSVLSLD